MSLSEYLLSFIQKLSFNLQLYWGCTGIGVGDDSHEFMITYYALMF